MTLLEKIDIVLKKYNEGKDNEYSLKFKKVIIKEETDNDYFYVSEDEICKITSGAFEGINFKWSIQELIGICILDNNPELFKQD